MFDSGISAEDFIENLKSEVDIAVPISNANYVMWLNTVEQLLYTEYIKELTSYSVEVKDYFPFPGFLTMSKIFIGEGEESPRFEDVYAVYADGVQLSKTTFASGEMVFSHTYYKKDNGIGISGYDDINVLTVIYSIKPKLKTTDKNGNITGGNVMIPPEFLTLVSAYIRGEAYKIANEDTIAAKWINDYNVLLETFKMWIDKRKSNFGL